MVVFNDSVQTRFDMLLGDTSGLEAIIKKLGAIRTYAQDVFGDMTKLATRSMVSISSAVNQSFPANAQFGAGGMEKSIQNTISSMDELARKQPLGEFMNNLGIGQAGGSKQALSAQQILEEVTAENFKNTLHMEKNMGMFAENTQKSNGLMSILADQSRSIGILMGLLFGGMTIQRWGMSIMRFVLPAMDQLQGYTSRGTKQVNAMKASFEFLKFSMFEAFTSTGLFQNFVGLLIKASNWLSKMASEHPAIVAIVGTLGATLAAGGWIMQIAGGFFQMGMLWRVLFGGGVSTAGEATSSIDGVKNKLGGLDRVLKNISVIGGITIAALSVTEAFSSDDLIDKVGFGVAGALGLAGAISAFFNPAVGITLTIAGGVVFAVTKFRTDIVTSSKAARAKIASEFLEGITGKDSREFMVGDGGLALSMATDRAIDSFVNYETQLANVNTELHTASASEIPDLLDKKYELVDSMQELVDVASTFNPEFQLLLDAYKEEQTLIDEAVKRQATEITSVKKLTSEYKNLAAAKRAANSPGSSSGGSNNNRSINGNQSISPGSTVSTSPWTGRQFVSSSTGD